MISEQHQRMATIGQTLSEAMKERRDCDWSKESPEINQALEALDEIVAEYVEGKASRDNVRLIYRHYASLHVVAQ